VRGAPRPGGRAIARGGGLAGRAQQADGSSAPATVYQIAAYSSNLALALASTGTAQLLWPAVAISSRAWLACGQAARR
jgi:hypothetical protein